MEMWKCGVMWRNAGQCGQLWASEAGAQARLKRVVRSGAAAVQA